MTAALGDAGYHKDLLEPHNQCVRGVIAAFRGHEIKTRGDGFHLVFGRADDALACVAHIQKSLAQAPITATDKTE
jgi:class 3 adenylate cyclase